MTITLLLISGCFLFLIYHQNRTKRISEIRELKLKISNELHDNIGSTLRQISAIAHNIGHKHKEVQESDIQLLKDRSNYVIRAMSDIVWSLDDNKILINDLIIRMHDYIESIASSTSLPYSFQTNDIDMNKYISNDKKYNIYLIFKEAVHNIVKHTHSSKVLIRIQKVNNGIELDITNHIESMKENSISSGRGLHSMKKRAQQIGGVLEVINNQSKFTVKLILT